MSTSNGAEKSIVVRAVQRRRYTDTNGRTVRRIIRLNGPILSSDLEGMKDGVLPWAFRGHHHQHLIDHASR